ncbi:hypothetical protein HDU79_008840 [Rhizoclosmatium sp. JEL0117]|nr:hypothetical protein HDU79_008840 [Rhizoclosmatium sp. JEL0117]
MNTHDHRQHAGELLVQHKRNSPENTSLRVESITSESMPSQHAAFFAALKYFAISSTDNLGRPWASLIATSPFVIDHDKLGISATNVPRDDPVAKCFATAKAGSPWAGLGIMFENRRRNKVAGQVLKNAFDGSCLDLTLQTNENMGNCPKYITVRDVKPFERKAETFFNDFGTTSSIQLTKDERDLINRCSTIYLATRHFTSNDASTDMGLNHRGGPPGFVRVLDQNGSSSLILPDYSGNRFYQSLGNVESDQLAGIVFVCFETGDTLHITGIAENLYDKDAENIMPRQTLITRITPTARVYIKNGLNLKLASPEQFSPYNPPLRQLRTELESTGKSITTSQTENTATITSIKDLTPSIKTFTFELTSPVTFLPGAFAIFDFSDVVQREYRHMNQGDPKQVNDDLVRTWTISSTPDVGDDGGFKPTRSISCTIKRVDGGRLSPLLHNLRQNAIGNLKIRLSGIGGGFSCFQDADGTVSNKKLLFIAGGVGVTPFLAMLEALRISKDVDVVVLFSARGAEANVLEPAVRGNKTVSQATVFDSTASKESRLDGFTLKNRRMGEPDFTDVKELLDRDVFLCGPTGFMQVVRDGLAKVGVSDSKIHQDSFNF